LDVIDVDTTKKLVTSAYCERQHVHAYVQPFLRLTAAAADGTVVLNCMKTDFTADICVALLATDLDLPL